MTNLVTKPDLVARLGRDFTTDEAARVDALIADTSALIRAYTGQDFAVVQNDTVVLRAQGGVIRLPQRPVIAVASVVAIGIDGTPDIPLVDWWWDGLDTIRLGEGNYVINLPEVWWDAEDGYPGTFQVIYSHGPADVPADVVAVGCGMILRTLTAPTAVGGVVSESIGPYSYRLESAGTGTAVTLSDAERAALARYRRKAGTMTVRI